MHRSIDERAFNISNMYMVFQAEHGKIFSFVQSNCIMRKFSAKNRRMVRIVSKVRVGN